MASKNLGENNLIRFISVTKKKEGLFVNFKVNGARAGVIFSSSISVDTMAAEVDMSDPLDQIIETCALIAVKEIKKADFQFEGIMPIMSSEEDF